MPFTPFHFGPGYLVKSIQPNRFHFLAFVISQVLIDCETAWNIFNHNFRLHTFLHTYIGSLTAVPATVLVVFIMRKLGKWIRISLYQKLIIEDSSHLVIALSALAGCWSHVFFDSIMHSDVQPFWPFGTKNSLNHIIDIGYLHIFCTVAGMIGLVWANRKELIKK